MRKKFAHWRFWIWVLAIMVALVLLDLPTHAGAVQDLLDPTPTPPVLLEMSPDPPKPAVDFESMRGFWSTLARVGPVMLLSAALGGLVAYHRQLTVFERDLFQAHILLSVAGALMMLIVGNELVRAFGLLGAASVVRYRHKLRDPRDASLLIIALGIGMATGAGLYALAVSASAVVAVFSQGLNFLTTRPNPLLRVLRPTTLKIRTTAPEATLARINRLFEQHGVTFRLKSYKLLPDKLVEDNPVYQLVYILQLGADDTRFEYTAQLSNRGIVGLSWKTDKPGRP